MGTGNWRIFTKQRLIPPGEGCSEVGPAAIVMEAAGSRAGAGEWHCCHPVTLRAPVLTPLTLPDMQICFKILNIYFQTKSFIQMFYTMINISKDCAINRFVSTYQHFRTTHGQFNISLTFKLMKTFFYYIWLETWDFQMPKKCYGINRNGRPYW